MAMDLIAAEHQKKINGKQAIFSLEENVHSLLLELAVPKKKFPAIHKIDDYYSDTVLLFGELKLFRDELTTIMNKSPAKQECFAELLSFIEVTIAAKNNIYAMAD